MPLWAGPLYGSIVKNESLDQKNKYWKYIYNIYKLFPSRTKNLLSQLKGNIMGRHDLVIYAIKK